MPAQVSPFPTPAPPTPIPTAPTSSGVVRERTTTPNPEDGLSLKGDTFAGAGAADPLRDARKRDLPFTVISIGDSMLEHYALQAIMWDIDQRRGCRCSREDAGVAALPMVRGTGRECVGPGERVRPGEVDVAHGAEELGRDGPGERVRPGEVGIVYACNKVKCWPGWEFHESGRWGEAGGGREMGGGERGRGGGGRLYSHESWNSVHGQRFTSLQASVAHGAEEVGGQSLAAVWGEGCVLDLRGVRGLLDASRERERGLVERERNASRDGGVPSEQGGLQGGAPSARVRWIIREKSSS